jgi:hypothetical protein
MKPFSTPVLSKRTYRELKLLKHLRHENVCIGKLFLSNSPSDSVSQVISLSDIFISPLEDMFVPMIGKISIQATDIHLATSSPSCWAPIFTACSPQDRLRSNSSNTFSTRSLFVPLETRHTKTRLTKYIARSEIRPLRRRCPP